jgi:hypothetical protein
VSVEPAGTRDVYDLVMADPARNFVAEGIIVHNCGKTRSASDASGGWYRNGVIRPMQASMIDGKPGVVGGVLVVCPRPVCKTWRDELAKWQNATGLAVMGGPTKKRRLACTPAHYHIVNYQGLSYVAHNQYDAVVVDECFPAGTPVETTRGPVPIDQVRVGDTVLSYDARTGGLTHTAVTTVLHKPSPEGALLRLHASGTNITCTEGHPFFVVGRGWTHAGALAEGDVLVVIRPNGLHGVREACGAEEANQQERQGILDASPDLQPGLPQPESPRVPDEVHGLRGPRGAHAPEQPDEGSSSPGQVAGDPAPHRALTPDPRWEREDRGARMGAVRSSDGCIPGLVHASAPQDGRGPGAPECAQAGRGEPVLDGSGGGGRQQSQQPVPAGAGHPEGYVLTLARLDRVEVVKPRGIAGHSELRGAVPCPVWNLEVEDTHTYFAGGFLVHNCHYLANNTNQTDYCLRLGARARRRLALSGTPISNSLKSIFYQMLFVDGGKSLGASRTAFLEKYFDRDDRYTKGKNGQKISIEDHKPKETAASAIAAAMAESTYFVKKEEVLDLPPKTHTPLYLDMAPEQEKYYNEMLEDSITFIQDAEVTAEQASARMMKLLQICQGFVLGEDAQGKDVGRHFSDAKTTALAELMQGELSGRKVIVWAFFQYEIQRLAKSLHDARVPFIRIDGTVTSQQARDDAMDRWNRDPDLRIYIRQLSMSEGVTLHAKDSSVPCMDTVYMGLDYRYVNWVQSQDRIHRIGQRFACSYRYLLTENGVDRAVYESVLGKHELATSVQAQAKDYYLHLLKRAKEMT